MFCSIHKAPDTLEDPPILEEPPWINEAKDILEDPLIKSSFLQIISGVY